MIDLSPLATVHPRLFQQTPVRSSSGCYPTFNLLMARSPGFGSTARDYAPLSDSVSLRLPYTVKLGTNCKSLTHYTKGTQSPLRAPTACTHTVSGSISLPSPGFFSPFPHGTGSLSVVNVYLALRSGLRRFTPAFPDPALLGNSNRSLITFVYRALTFCGAPFLNASTSQHIGNSVTVLVHRPSGPTTPNWQRHQA